MNDARMQAWTDATTAACLYAVMPHALAGLRLRAGAGPVRDYWLKLLYSLLEEGSPVQRIHPQIDDAALIGGLDLAATLARGATTRAEGILSKAHGGVVVLAMAERCSAALAARLAVVLDAGLVSIERDGVTATRPASFGIVMLDEGEDGELPPAALLDRASFDVDLTEFSMRDCRPCSFGVTEVIAARSKLAQVDLPGEMLEGIAAAALAFGVTSLRMSMLACTVARVSAALAGRIEVEQSDAALAARLVLVPRALLSPDRPANQRERAEEQTAEDKAVDQEDSAAPKNTQDSAGEMVPDQQASPPTPASDRDDTQASHQDKQEPPSSERPEALPPNEVVLEATLASLPADLLNRLIARVETAGLAKGGRSGNTGINASKGRPLAALPQQAAGHARLDLISTLRAAVPWQALRRKERQLCAGRPPRAVDVRRQDFRARRYVSSSRTTTIFAVDASGSAALHRLSETKGAVELMLGQCYLRRDQVAVISFRDNGATVTLPPTRSLVRAKRCLAGMVGGGGTPLAAALDALVVLADAIRRRGDRPIVVVLSDGKANVATDHSRNRDIAHHDAMRAALNLRRMQLTSLFVDTSMRPGERAATIATQMGARYMALPFVDAERLSRAVMDVS